MGLEHFKILSLQAENKVKNKILSYENFVSYLEVEHRVLSSCIQKPSIENHVLYLETLKIKYKQSRNYQKQRNQKHQISKWEHHSHWMGLQHRSQPWFWRLLLQFQRASSGVSWSVIFLKYVTVYHYLFIYWIQTLRFLHQVFHLSQKLKKRKKHILN